MIWGSAAYFRRPPYRNVMKRRSSGEWKEWSFPTTNIIDESNPSTRKMGIKKTQIDAFLAYKQYELSMGT
jgi:hypothetical protein